MHKSGISNFPTGLMCRSSPSTEVLPNDRFRKPLSPTEVLHNSSANSSPALIESMPYEGVAPPLIQHNLFIFTLAIIEFYFSTIKNEVICMSIYSIFPHVDRLIIWYLSLCILLSSRRKKLLKRILFFYNQGLVLIISTTIRQIKRSRSSWSYLCIDCISLLR